MALVKFSVFSGSDSTKSMSEYRDQMHSNGTMMKSENIRPSNMLPSECSIQGFQATTLGASSTLKLTDNGLTRLNGSVGGSNNNSNNTRQATNSIQANFGGTVSSKMATNIMSTRDNQFDYHYLACQSPHWWAPKTGASTATSVSSAAQAPAPSTKITTVPISLSNGSNVLPDHSEHYELDANIISLSSQQYQQHRQQQQQQKRDFDCQAVNKLFGANKRQQSSVSPAAGCYLNGINVNSKNSSIGGAGFGGRSNNNENKFNKSNRVDSQLQIMNYFLQTWNGTQSAHDAINKLQVRWIVVRAKVSRIGAAY